MWPPENWRQIHHSDKIDMNKIFKGNFIDTHRFSDVHLNIYTRMYTWMNDRQDSDMEQKIIQLEHASSFPTICLEFDLKKKNIFFSFFLRQNYLQMKWECFSNIYLFRYVTYNIFQMKSRYGKIHSFLPFRRFVWQIIFGDRK